MRGHREVSHNLRGTLLASPRNPSNSFRITSLAHPHRLTSMESHPYEKQGEGGTRSACPPVFRTFFQVPYPLSLVFSHSSKNDRGGGGILLYPECGEGPVLEPLSASLCELCVSALSLFRFLPQTLSTFKPSKVQRSLFHQSRTPRGDSLVLPIFEFRFSSFQLRCASPIHALQ